jgi:phenylacetate-CoA ligase
LSPEEREKTNGGVGLESGGVLLEDKPVLGDAQIERFNETLRRARSSSFYRRRLAGLPLTIESLTEVRRFPITSKAELREGSPWDFVAAPQEELVEYHESFGTTGEPVSIWATKHDFSCWTKQILDCAVDFKPEDIVMIRFPYAISVPAHTVQAAARTRGACTIPVSSRTSISPFTRVIRLMDKLKGSVLACNPFEAILLGETAKLMGLDPARDFPSLRAICVAGEMLVDARKAQIERLWNVKVYNLYGSTETGNIAATCAEGKMHVSADHFLLEVLDPVTYEPLDPSQRGLLAVTTTFMEGTPLIRYDTRDIVRLLPGESCSCGSKHPVLEHFGRYDQRIRLEGEEILLGDLQETILTAPGIPIGLFWMVYLNGQGLVIRMETACDRSGLIEAEAYLSEKLKVRCEIEPVPQGTLYDREKLLAVESVCKAKYVADWRVGGWYPRTLHELIGRE